MGRPRKDSGSLDMKTRLVEAFWELLESNDIHEISIGMIATRTGVNRGTFYYHFESKEELLGEVMSRELARTSDIVFSLVSGVDPANDTPLTSEYLSRVALFMEHGGRNAVECRVKEYIEQIWTKLLCPKGETLKRDTRLVIEYMGSGMLGLISYLGSCEGEEGGVAELPIDLLRRYSGVALSIICETEGIEREDLLSRFRMFNRLSESGMA